MRKYQNRHILAEPAGKDTENAASRIRKLKSFQFSMIDGTPTWRGIVVYVKDAVKACFRRASMHEDPIRIFRTAVAVCFALFVTANASQAAWTTIYTFEKNSISHDVVLTLAGDSD